MDSISLHLDIENSLNQTLKQTQVLMKNFNNAMEISTKNMGAIEKKAKATTIHYDDLEESSEKIAKSSISWSGSLSKIRSNVSQIIPTVATLFSVAGILESVKAVLEYNTQLKNLSYRMGDAGESITDMRKSLYGIVQDTGLASDKVMTLVSDLKKSRIATEDIRELGTAIGRFSEITGMTAEGTTKLGAELVRTGKLSISSAKAVLTSMAQVQRQVGLTDAEMEQLGTSVVENTRWLKGMNKSSDFIENFSKGTAKLAASFRSVGIEVSEATDLLDRMLDPMKIEDNALLFAKLGISMEDALSGDIDPGELANKFKDLSGEMSGMSRMAQGQLAQSMGVSLKTIQAMGDAQTDFIDGGAGLKDMYDEQASPEQRLERTMNKMKGVMENAMSFGVESIDKVFSKVDDLKKEFLSLPIFDKSKWAMVAVAAGVLLVILGKKLKSVLKKAVFSLVDLFKNKFFFKDYSNNLESATAEAIKMGQRKASVISERQTRRTGRREARTSRVELGPDAADMEGMATVYDQLAKSDLFPKVKKMMEHTAETYRYLATGAKSTSKLSNFSDQYNESVRDRIQMQAHEKAEISTVISLEIKRRNDSKAGLAERLSDLHKIQETTGATARQQKEMSIIGKELEKNTKVVSKLENQRAKERDRLNAAIEKSINNLQPAERKNLYLKLKDEREILGARLSGLKQQRESLEIQKKVLLETKGSLKTEIGAAIARGDSNDEIIKMNNQLKEMEAIYDEVVQSSQQVNLNINETSEGLSGSNKELRRVNKALGPGKNKFLEITDSDVKRSGKITKLMGAAGAALKSGWGGMSRSFVRAKESAKKLGLAFMEKIKPANILRNIKAGLRDLGGGSAVKGAGVASVNAMKGLGKSMKGLGKVFGMVGIGMLLLRPLLQELQPVMDQIKDVFLGMIKKIAPIFKKLFTALMPVFETLVDKLLMPLVDALLPPLITVLGVLVGALGSLLTGIAKLAGKLGVRGMEGLADFGTALSEAGANMKNLGSQMQADRKARQIALAENRRNMEKEQTTSRLTGDLLSNANTLRTLQLSGESGKALAQEQLTQTILEQSKVLRDRIRQVEAEKMEGAVKNLATSIEKLIPSGGNASFRRDALINLITGGEAWNDDTEKNLRKDFGDEEINRLFEMASGLKGLEITSSDLFAKQGGFLGIGGEAGAGRARTASGITRRIGEENIETQIDKITEEQVQKKFKEMYGIDLAAITAGAKVNVEEVLANAQASYNLSQTAINRLEKELEALNDRPDAVGTVYEDGTVAGGATGSAGSQAQQLRAINGGIEQESAMALAEERTANATEGLLETEKQMVESTEALLVTQNEQNDKLDALVLTLGNFTSTFQMWMNTQAN